MGADVAVLGNHKLDVTNIHNVAKFLAHKLNINIKYGYYYNEDQNVLRLEKNEETFISLGKIELNKDKPFWTLEDEMHQAKMAYEIIGDKVFNYDEFWIAYTNNVDPLPELSRRERLLKGHHSLESFTPNENYGFLDICDEVYASFLADTPHWGSFLNILLEDEYFKNYRQHLIDYRLENKKFAELMGSEKLYYVSNEARELPGFGEAGECGYSWEEVEKTILKAGGGEVYSISELFTNRKSHQKYMKKYWLYPEFFVDDFKDLS